MGFIFRLETRAKDLESQYKHLVAFPQKLAEIGLSKMLENVDLPTSVIFTGYFVAEVRYWGLSSTLSSALLDFSAFGTKTFVS
jgi:hypothetical protein